MRLAPVLLLGAQMALTIVASPQAQAKTKTYRKPLLLTVSYKAGKGFIDVTYRLKNRGNKTVYVLDGNLIERPGQDLRDQVEAFFEKPAIAHLKRVLPTPPPGRKLVDNQVPWIAELKPHKTRTVQFRLLYPLVERDSNYPNLPTSKFAWKAVTKMRLTLGYRVEAPGVRDSLTRAEPKRLTFKFAQPIAEAAPTLSEWAREQLTVSAVSPVRTYIKTRLDRPDQRTTR